MIQFTTLNDVFVALLRTSGITDLQGNDYEWDKQPFFGEAPEGINQYPFVAFQFPSDSQCRPTFPPAYDEEHDLKVEVYCQADLYVLTDPRAPTQNSIIAYLDSLWNVPQSTLTQPPGLAWTNTSFQTQGWYRTSYRLHESQFRGPNTGRVWVGEAHYKWTINSSYPVNT